MYLAFNVGSHTRLTLEYYYGKESVDVVKLLLSIQRCSITAQQINRLLKIVIRKKLVFLIKKNYRAHMFTNMRSIPKIIVFVTDKRNCKTEYVFIFYCLFGTSH